MLDLVLRSLCYIYRGGMYFTERETRIKFIPQNSLEFQLI